MRRENGLTTLRPDINPWERQEPAESELMYSRFLVFRDLPPESDRLRQTLEILNSTGDKRLTYSAIKDYSSAFRWSARATAHDRYRAQADRGRMIRQRRKVIDAQISAAGTLRAKALEALRNIDVLDLKPNDIVRFIELGWKIEQSIFAEYSEGATPTVDTGKESVGDIASWSPSERRRRLEVLRDELTRRAVRAADDDEVVA